MNPRAPIPLLVVIYLTRPITACSSGCPGDAPAVTPADAAACEEVPLPQPESTQGFRSLSATIVDPSGAPRADAPVTVCSFDLCLTAQIDATGAAYVENASGDPPLRGPAFKIGDGLTFAELAYALPDRPDFVLGSTVAIPLPDFAQGVPLAPGETSSMGGLSLTLAPGAAIGFDPLTYPPDERGLRVTSISLADPPAAFDPSARIEVAYAIAPQGTTFCPPASLEVPNPAGWAPGSAVEVLVHGVDLAQAWAPYGGWAVVAAGNVSSDGQRIHTAPGSGLPVLSTIGVRRK